MSGRDRRHGDQPRQPAVRVAAERPVADRREPRRDEAEPVLAEVDEQRHQRPDVEHRRENASDVRNGSSQPSRYGTRIRCPDDEIGRNSVSPCTIPMTSA